MAGIAWINHANETQIQEISNYINSLKNNIQSSVYIDKTAILIQSIKQNLILTVTIWFLGCTLLGSILIYGAVLYKGFSIGYTASAMIASLGVKSRYNFYCVCFVIPKFSFFTDVMDIIR